MKNIQQPIKVAKINCPECGELQVKVYPWSSYVFELRPGMKVNVCKLCINKKSRTLKSGVAQ